MYSDWEVFESRGVQIKRYHCIWINVQDMMAFLYMDKDMMKKILTSMIRPRLEFAAVVWSPYCKKRI